MKIRLLKKTGLTFELIFCFQLTRPLSASKEKKPLLLFENSIEFFADKDCYRLHFNSNDLYNKLDVLEKLSIKVDSSFLAYVPKDEIGLSEHENQKIEKLLEFLDDLEDVQNVFSNQSLGKS